MAEKLPLWRNVRWPQLVFGALFGIVGWQLAQHLTGNATLTGGALAGRIIILTVAFFAFVIYLQNVYRFGLVPDYSLKCRFCNGPVNRYSEFCEHCGADLIAEEKLVPCPKCGVEVMEGTKFCPECGSAVSRPKGKKGKKAKTPPPEPDVGWDAPIDAVTGFPPDERR